MSSSAELRHTEEVMGTIVSFTVVASAHTTSAAARAVGEACAILRRDDEMFSTWKPHSAMSQLRSGATLIDDAPELLREVLALSERAKRLSGGWFDPWAMPGGVDPTGLVKGWSVERALRCLVEGGFPDAVINAGGDIACAGRPPGRAAWRFGIRHPWQPAAFAGVVEVTAAMATSGDYERPGQLIDPHSGRPTHRNASATVIGPSLALADALATGLAVGGAEVLAALEATDGYEAYLIDASGTERSTTGFVFVEP